MGAVVIVGASGCGGDDRRTETTGASSTTAMTAVPTTAAASSSSASVTSSLPAISSSSTSVTSSLPAVSSSSTTAAPTDSSMTTPNPPVVLALPGRLPSIDATDEITALFPTPIAALSPLELVPEIIGGLQSSFAATGFFADVGLVSHVSSPLADGEEVALVFEIRNREESGDDTTPGYDLVVIMQSDQAGNWVVTSAARQTICSRGAAWGTDPPLCI
jgi:hypothetical protein